MPIGLITDHQKKAMVILGLIVLILAVYWQVQYFEFVNYDDQLYVTQNFKTQSGVTWESFFGAFTDLRSSNWHPLTMLSHALDWQLFGDKAGGHHWTNLIIHIFNTVFLFLLLNTMTGAIWRSAAVAALFAVHPMNVESVAWIAERKNVLSTFFWIVTMQFYTWYVRKPGWKRYWPIVISFALGLMSKPMLVTLPFVLLLMDYWPLNRIGSDGHSKLLSEDDRSARAEKAKWTFLVWEKIPLFILTTISIALTVYAANYGNTIANNNDVPLLSRISNALLSYAVYLQKLIWPTNLTVFYPLKGILMQEAIPAAVLLLVITVICCKYYKKYPYLPVGWFWYLGTLVPVIGIVQVGLQSMADRYAYVPFIGIFIMFSWAVADLGRSRLLQKVTMSLMVMVIICLSVTAQHQVGYWKNSFSLFERALRVTKDNFMAHVVIGNELVKQEKFDEAIAHFYKAININLKSSANYVAFGSLGIALSAQNKKTEAIAAFKEALSINPTYDEAFHRIGLIYFDDGRVDDAIAEYQKAILLYNDYPLYHSSLGNAYIAKGRTEDAIKEYKEVLRIQPANIYAHNNLGLLYMNSGRLEEALKHFQEAIRIQPLFANAHYRLSVIFKEKGQSNKALYHYNEAVRINPSFGEIK